MCLRRGWRVVTGTYLFSSARGIPGKKGLEKGCAQGWNYGFIPLVKTGGEMIFLPEATDCGTLARVIL